MGRGGMKMGWLDNECDTIMMIQTNYYETNRNTGKSIKTENDKIPRPVGGLPACPRSMVRNSAFAAAGRNRYEEGGDKKTDKQILATDTNNKTTI